MSPVRRAFAHDALVRLAPGGDEGAPGAAITVALCGHWEHEPPCPLAPHATRAERSEDGLRLRTLFVVEPELEGTVRDRIGAALRSGALTGPGEVHTTWELASTGPTELAAGEIEHARRLMRG
jgi:hypothetical protein